MHKITNNVLSEDEFKQFTKDVVKPYSTNNPCYSFFFFQDSL
jgi:hypothetical protein